MQRTPQYTTEQRIFMVNGDSKGQGEFLQGKLYKTRSGGAYCTRHYNLG